MHVQPRLADVLLTIEQRETEVLKKLNHPNIVEFYGYIKTVEMLYFVMEYVEEGAFTSVLKDFETIPERLAAIYIKQVLEGLAYLHKEGVIHRDLKGSNILLTKAGNVKLADFGVSAIINENEKRFSVVGTPYWMAPEVIEISGHSYKSDVWSVGSLICELITGNPPYYDMPPMTAIFHIVQHKSPPLPEGISPDLTDFLRKCWTPDPEERPSVTDLLQHVWITADNTEEDKMLKPKSFDVKQLLAEDEPSNMSPRSLQTWRVSQGAGATAGNGNSNAPSQPQQPQQQQPQSPRNSPTSKTPVSSPRTRNRDAESPKKDGDDMDDDEKTATVVLVRGSEGVGGVKGASGVVEEGGEATQQRSGNKKKDKKKKRKDDTVHISLKSLRLKKGGDHHDDASETAKKKQEEKLSRLMDQLESEAQRPRCKHGLNCKSTDAMHFLKFVHTPENPELSKNEKTREELLWEKLDYCQKENTRLSSQIISLEHDLEKLEGQRDHYVLQLAERAARDDEIIALANAALAACMTDDEDVVEPPATGEGLEEEDEEYEARLYKREVKRRLERLVEERKAAAVNEASEMLISMASLGRNAKEKKKEVKRMIKDRKKEEKKYKEGIEKLKKQTGRRKRASTMSLVHTFHIGKGSRMADGGGGGSRAARHSALIPQQQDPLLMSGGTNTSSGRPVPQGHASAPPSTTASPVAPASSPPASGSFTPERRRTDKL